MVAPERHAPETGGDTRPTADDASTRDANALFPGHSEMSERCRAFDWDSGPLGPVDHWPVSLRTTAAIVLAAPIGMILLWGSELVQLYNDHYREVMGVKHPAGLGQRNFDCWPEVWDFTAPIYEGVMERGESFTFVDQPLTLERHGQPDQGYFTLSYTPVPDDEGRIGGILVTVIETTSQVRARSEREQQLLQANTRLRFAMEIAEIGAWELDLATDSAWRSPLHDEIFGYPDGRDSWSYDDFLAHVHAADRVSVHEQFTSALAVNGAWDFVCRIHRGDDGAERWIAGVGEVVATAGRPARMIGVVRDVTEQQRAAQRLQESESRFRLMADAVPHIVWLTDADGGIEFFNAQWTRYTGTAFEPETAAVIANSHLHPDDAAATTSGFAEARRTGGVFVAENRLRAADGSYRWFLVRAEPYRNPRTGVIERWFGASTDIHDHKLAESARAALLADVNAERERLRALVLYMPAPVALHEGPEHRFALVNDAYKRVSGGGRDVTGLTPREAFPELTGTGIHELFDEVYATGTTWFGPETHVWYDRDGTGLVETWFTIRLEPVRNAESHVVGILNFSLDVTEQVRARQGIEAMLKESEAARVDAVRARERSAATAGLTAALSSMQSVHDVVDVIVRQTTEVFAASGTVMARVSSDMAWVDLVGAIDMPETAQQSWHRFPISAPVPLADAARTGEPIFLASRDECAARYPALLDEIDAAGHEAMMVLPLVVDGHTLGVLGVAFRSPRDFDADDRALALTIARQSAQALDRARLFDGEQAARREAEAANRAKSEFLTVMSHELRTPLNAIDGYAELMELGIRGPTTELQRHDLARIRKSQKHLLGLINGVLNYARVEAGVVHYEFESVLVDEALIACEALVTPQVRAQGLTLVRHPGAPNVTVCADREKLQQILLNLLSNAVKFTEAGGRIDLSYAQDVGVSGPVVRLTVADTGIGLAAPQRARVFEPFVQVDAELTRTRDGTGLGLAISRDLALAMEGELTVESELGVGSRFTLTLPMT